MKRIFLLLIFIAFAFNLSAQTLYWPRNIKKAYKNTTRSNDGWPGIKYWQNTAHYTITMTALPPNRNIKGTEQITYINNSPDTLHELVFKFIQNIHKPGAPRLGTAPADFLTDGVHVDSFAIDGEKEQWHNKDNSPTIQFARLTKPLLPHDSVKVGFGWHYEISLKSKREGMIDATTYFLAYFYPRVAVYDDYNGWDTYDHTDIFNFYNDFNDYVLHVKVPENYIVWATGNLLNGNEVLQPAYLQRLNESMKTDDVIHIVTAADLASKNITKQNGMNTWTFAFNDISDMALGLSDHYVWDASSVIVDEKINRRASIQAAYNDTAGDYHQMVSFGQSALRFLSGKWPGVAYPYPKMTVFQGYAGMEYPMMANDESYPDFTFSRLVAAHEISHTWFPFYMGTNEARFGFMDEGWATTFELLFNRSVMPKDSADEFYKKFRVANWIHDGDADEDLPIITPGYSLSQRGFGSNNYGKPSLGYLALKDMLGDDLFRKCLHTFMDHWHGRHPVPWDFFYTFNTVSGENLNWFWNAWFFSHNYIDVAIDYIHETKGGCQVAIQNIGGFPVPVDLQLNFKDGSKQTIHQSPAIWAMDKKQVTIDVKTGKPIESAQLISGIFMDADESNNFLKYR
ncbi:MAG TPA: M1 family metallopeptidase [Hanamia sp.]